MYDVGYGGGKCPPLFLAVRQGAPRSTVDLLAATGAYVGWANEDGFTALHMAPLDDHTKLVRALGGTHSAALDAQDRDGETPLHLAAMNGKTAAARALLELGADASVRTTYRETALEHASAPSTAEQKGKHETAQLLRDHATILETHSVTGAEAAKMLEARDSGLADAALPPGTRLRVDPHGDGTYARFERSLFGASAHLVRFDGGGQAEQPIELKGLAPSAWSVLPGTGALDQSPPQREPGPKPQPQLPLPQRAAAARASPRWVPAAEAAACMVCEVAAFSLLERPHHCRFCGWLACGCCSGGKMPLERWLDSEAPHSVRETRSAQPLRACDLCLPHAAVAGVAAAQLEPEPEPEPAAVAEAVPVLPLHARNLQLQGVLRRRGSTRGARSRGDLERADPRPLRQGGHPVEGGGPAVLQGTAD